MIVAEFLIAIVVIYLITRLIAVHAPRLVRMGGKELDRVIGSIKEAGRIIDEATNNKDESQ